MWNWFNCYLSGRHEFGVWCEPGAIFLRCVHCGKRSAGWAVGSAPNAAAATEPHAHAVAKAATVAKPTPVAKPTIVAAQPAPRTRSRVVAFGRVAAR